MQSSFTGAQKQDSHQQTHSVSIDVSVGVSQTSQGNSIIKVSLLFNLTLFLDEIKQYLNQVEFVMQKNSLV